MYINNIDIVQFDAELYSKQIGTKEINSETEWNRNKFLIKDQQKLSLPLNVELIVKGEDINILEKNISNIIKESQKCSIKFKDIDFFLDGIVKSSSPKYIGKDLMDDKETSLLNLDFEVYYKYEQEKTINFNKSNDLTIFVGGNDTTPAIVEINPSMDVASVNITGFREDITLNNLTIDNTVILDGVKGLITENGENKFPDYDSWGFPRLEPGENNISLDDNTLDIVIKYKPRWI